eukprot:c20376_g1_i1.p1 GENE.c20376_g1_i1~~c20376_g1_i1.p1  ORF type:complete len:282 (-),score=58.03 c20376_g1_i1:111-956(-)
MQIFVFVCRARQTHTLLSRTTLGRMSSGSPVQAPVRTGLSFVAPGDKAAGTVKERKPVFISLYEQLKANEKEDFELEEEEFAEAGLSARVLQDDEVEFLDEQAKFQKTIENRIATEDNAELLRFKLARKQVTVVAPVSATDVVTELKQKDAFLREPTAAPSRKRQKPALVRIRAKRARGEGDTPQVDAVAAADNNEIEAHKSEEDEPPQRVEPIPPPPEQPPAPPVSEPERPAAVGTLETPLWKSWDEEDGTRDYLTVSEAVARSPEFCPLVQYNGSDDDD